MLCRVLCVLFLLAFTAEAPNDTVLYGGLWRSPFEALGGLFVSLPGLNLFAWQVILIGLAPFCLLRPGAFRRRDRTMDVAVLVSLTSIALTFLWGWMRGGSAYNAYYQLWRFLVALLVGVLLLSVIRRPVDLKAIGLTVLLASLVRGGLAIYFYWAVVRGRIEPAPPYMTTHDDSLLFVVGVLIALGWALIRGTPTAWLAAVPVSATLLYAIVLNNRRLAWIELLLAFALMYLVLPRGRIKRRVNR